MVQVFSVLYRNFILRERNEFIGRGIFYRIADIYENPTMKPDLYLYK